MNKFQEALDELYSEATNGENEFIKQKYIRSINENKAVLQELIDTSENSNSLLKNLIELWSSDGDEVSNIVWAHLLHKIKKHPDKKELVELIGDLVFAYNNKDDDFPHEFERKAIGLACDIYLKHGSQRYTDYFMTSAKQTMEEIK